MYKKKVAIIQSNYIPWVGYFAAIASVDLFIVYECVQYTKNDWRNRNKIQANDGQMTWLSIPVRQYSSKQEFMNTTVANHDWAQKHLNTLQHHFAHTKGWIRKRDEIQSLYGKAEKLSYLFEINRLFLAWIIKELDISTEIIYLDSYPKYDDPNERLISILKNFGTTHYLSGPAAKSYIDPFQFIKANINLDFINYEFLITQAIELSHPVKLTSTLQLIFESNNEFKCNRGK